MNDIKELLFKPVIEREKWHPNFQAIIDHRSQNLRDVIYNWAEGFKDRDHKFIRQFQETFNSSFWELYLFAVLKELKLPVDFQYDRPDFIVNSQSGFCIEATTANPPQHGVPEWQKDYSEEDIKKWPINKIVDHATIRLANSFVGKAKHWEKSYSKLPYVQGKPFILAIAPFDSPYFYAQNLQAIDRVLYGFDKYITTNIDEHNREIIDTVYIESIKKENGKSIPLGYFRTPEFSYISAVIFSNTATFSKVRALSQDSDYTLFDTLRYNDYGLEPTRTVTEKSSYKESLLDGLYVFHNPYADIPFTVEEFYHKDIAHMGFDIVKGELTSCMPHNFLYQRMAITLKMGSPTKK